MIWFLIDGGQSVVVCHYLLFDHSRKSITKKKIILIFALSGETRFLGAHWTRRPPRPPYPPLRLYKRTVQHIIIILIIITSYVFTK